MAQCSSLAALPPIVVSRPRLSVASKNYLKKWASELDGANPSAIQRTKILSTIKRMENSSSISYSELAKYLRNICKKRLEKQREERQSRDHLWAQQETLRILFPTFTPKNFHDLEVFFKGNNDPSDGILEFWVEHLQQPWDAVKLWIRNKRAQLGLSNPPVDPNPAYAVDPSSLDTVRKWISTLPTPESMSPVLSPWESDEGGILGWDSESARECNTGIGPDLWISTDADRAPSRPRSPSRCSSPPQLPPIHIPQSSVLPPLTLAVPGVQRPPNPLDYAGPSQLKPILAYHLPQTRPSVAPLRINTNFDSLPVKREETTYYLSNHVERHDHNSRQPHRHLLEQNEHSEISGHQVKREESPSVFLDPLTPSSVHGFRVADYPKDEVKDEEMELQWPPEEDELPQQPLPPTPPPQPVDMDAMFIQAANVISQLVPTPREVIAAAFGIPAGPSRSPTHKASIHSLLNPTPDLITPATANHNLDLAPSPSVLGYLPSGVTTPQPRSPVVLRCPHQPCPRVFANQFSLGAHSGRCPCSSRYKKRGGRRACPVLDCQETFKRKQDLFDHLIDGCGRELERDLL